jgi:hypothetical protein
MLQRFVPGMWNPSCATLVHVTAYRAIFAFYFATSRFVQHQRGRSKASQCRATLSPYCHRDRCFKICPHTLHRQELQQLARRAWLTCPRYTSQSATARDQKYLGLALLDDRPRWTLGVTRVLCADRIATALFLMALDTEKDGPWSIRYLEVVKRS